MVSIVSSIVFACAPRALTSFFLIWLNITVFSEVSCYLLNPVIRVVFLWWPSIPAARCSQIISILVSDTECSRRSGVCNTAFRKLRLLTSSGEKTTKAWSVVSPGPDLNLSRPGAQQVGFLSYFFHLKTKIGATSKALRFNNTQTMYKVKTNK
jgi:hypothetical protein